MSNIHNITFIKGNFQTNLTAWYHLCFYPVRIYAQLPEVQRRKEEERRKAEYYTYRLKAQLFNKVNRCLLTEVFLLYTPNAVMSVMSPLKLMRVIFYRKSPTTCWEEERLGSSLKKYPNILLQRWCRDDSVLSVCLCLCWYECRRQAVVLSVCDQMYRTPLSRCSNQISFYN